MRYFPLVFKNLIRSRRRSFLTFLSIAVSFFIFTALFSLLSELSGNPDETISGDGITVRSKSGPLPFGHIKAIAGRFCTPDPSGGLSPEVLDQIAREGFQAGPRDPVRVDAMMGMMWGFNGKIGEQEIRISIIDPKSVRTVWTDMKTVPEEYFRAFVADRKSILLGEKWMEEFKYKVGDTIEIPLRGQYGEFRVSFTIAGPSQAKGMWANTSYVHRSYIEDLVQKSEVGMVFINIRRKSDLVPILTELAEMFTNRSPPIEAEPSNLFMQDLRSVMKAMNKFLIIVTVFVVGIVLLIAANSMTMSIQARINDIAILKTVGYTRGKVVAFLLGEAAILGLAGGIAGCGLAFMTLGRIPFPIGPAGYFTVDSSAVAYGIGLALLVGAGSGLVPALRASRMNIVDAMRRVE